MCEPLEVEDYVIQSMPDASPVKWHLAHTTWFFETFVIRGALKDHNPFHPQYGFLFNSYYNAVGERHERAQRGVLSRPSVDEVVDYRRHVDEAVVDVCERGLSPKLQSIMTLGIHHEQQHQELLVTDVKHAFSCNALAPVYRRAENTHAGASRELRWHSFPGALHEIGHRDNSFCFDNELPRHQAYVNGFRIASRLSTNAEYLEFIQDGGYERPELWLSDGWDFVREHNLHGPLYWLSGDERRQFTLQGVRGIEPDAPVCHVSYYEADAFARWSGARLPTEFEWEVAAATCGGGGNFAESGRFHPLAGCADSDALQQFFGDVWEWTSSPYSAYPGYQPASGALGEYNGKFMCNQFVLRGGSCATPATHIRPTYRNFFHPEKRWQFSGIRLAGDERTTGGAI